MFVCMKNNNQEQSIHLIADEKEHEFTTTCGESVPKQEIVHQKLDFFAASTYREYISVCSCAKSILEGLVCN